jgi:hypothetical protein
MSSVQRRKPGWYPIFCFVQRGGTKHSHPPIRRPRIPETHVSHLIPPWSPCPHPKTDVKISVKEVGNKDISKRSREQRPKETISPIKGVRKTRKKGVLVQRSIAPTLPSTQNQQTLRLYRLRTPKHSMPTKDLSIREAFQNPALTSNSQRSTAQAMHPGHRSYLSALQHQGPNNNPTPSVINRIISYVPWSAFENIANSDANGRFIGNDASAHSEQVHDDPGTCQSTRAGPDAKNNPQAPREATR